MFPFYIVTGTSNSMTEVMGAYDSLEEANDQADRNIDEFEKLVIDECTRS